jgi:hypothetical protein
MSDVMSDEKWEYEYESTGDRYSAKVKQAEKDYLDKLVNDHWSYIKGVLEVAGAIQEDIEMCEYHYKTAAKHFWSHAREYHVGDTL